MEKTLKIFKSFSDVEKEGKEYYRALSPQQRIEILLTLIAPHQRANEATEGFKRVYRIVKRS